jgi:hypothetical protein
MSRNRAIIVILSLFLFLNINPFYSFAKVRAKVYNCNGKPYPYKHTAKRLINDLNTAAKRAPNCLPPGLANSVKNNALSLEIEIYVCNIEDCAESNKFWHRITIGSASALLGEGNCGCIESIMLHELLHLGGLGSSPEEELKAESCELNCFPDCAVVSSNASKDKCCDDKK